MRLNKALGQNFFNNHNLADWIVAEVAKSNPKTVIEIGPGDGYFSKRLELIAEKLLLIEKDTELAEFLRLKLPKAEIANEDVMEYEIDLDRYTKPIVIYGSLPYNISKLIIEKFIQTAGIDSMYFIIQKEVAEKYTFAEGKSSILSLITSLYGDVEILKLIKPGNFIPKPKVESALIKIKYNSNSGGIDVEKFKIIVKTAFSNPRKTLRNNLKKFDTSQIDSLILARRAETLNLNEYKDLVSKIVI
ncbi:ribosomal RNA small subunit methyltransferase A [Candidatus Dojkabacteria bacterium]|nr:ribosomal RNA small subunit methyltransferase A [Candidatus Dojkabacteria bacterium]